MCESRITTVKRICKSIVVPLHIWEHGDLSIIEKHVLIDIDSICASTSGVSVGPQALSSMAGLPVKTIKETLNSLFRKGALDVSLSEDGVKLLKPLLYKERYLLDGKQPTLGDTPRDIEGIDYVFIQTKWNEICHMLPKMERITPRRKQKTRTMLKGAGASVQDLIKVFKLIATSSFLNGNKGTWRCSYDWLTKSPDNFQKVYEGNYHKDIREKQDYDAIMSNRDVNDSQPSANDLYR